MKQYLSFSELYLWHKDKDQYIRQYVLGEEFQSNPAMELGSLIHKVLEEPRYPWLKEAKEMGLKNNKILAIRKIVTKMAFTRPKESEVSIRTTNHDPELFSIFDGFDREQRVLYEFKTTANPKSYSQWRVDTHMQLTFYAYIYHQIYHQYFRDIFLYVCDTSKGGVKVYKTARGWKDIEFMGNYIRETKQQMVDAGVWEKRMSKEDKIKSKNLTLF